MTTTFHINSYHRNRAQYPNPCDFGFGGKIGRWDKKSPKVTSNVASSSLGRSGAFSSSGNQLMTTYAEDYVSSLKLKSLIVPYAGNIVEANGAETYPTPQIYVTLSQSGISSSSGGEPLGSIRGIETGSGFDYFCVSFVTQIAFDKCIRDTAGDIIFCVYEPLNTQIATFRRDKDFRITLRLQSQLDQLETCNVADNAPPADPDKLLQTRITFEEIPYIRDGEYSNHELEIYTP